jgi:hypothetical protein
MKLFTAFIVIAAAIAGSSAAAVSESKTPPICILICFPEKPECAPGWKPTKHGECWTCCKPDHDDDY